MFKKTILFSFLLSFCFAKGQSLLDPQRITNGEFLSMTTNGEFMDVTNDGLDDFVVLKDEEFINSGSKRYVAYYEATSTGAYKTAQKIQGVPYLSSSIEKIYFIDIDNDGDDDLVLTSDLTGIIMYPNIGGGNFGSEVILRPPFFGIVNFSMHPKFFDYDLDGDLDAFINSDYHEYRLLINDNMNFVDSTILFDGDNINTARLADMDNNGKLDILAEKSTDNFLHIHLNNNSTGMSSSTTTLPFNLGLSHFVLGINDINGDGNLDVVVSDISDIGVYYNNGSTYSYQNLFTIPNNGTTSNLQFEDINNDGFTDILGGINYMNILLVVTQDASGNFTINQELEDGIIQVNGMFEFKDLDNDGFKEFYNWSPINSSPLQISIYDNVQGSFEFQENELCLGFDSFDVGDINNDGKMDVVKISAKTNSYQIMLNNGDKTYTMENRSLPFGNQELNGVKIGKYNTDNLLDIFVYEETQNNDMRSYVIEAQNNLQFLPPVSLTSGQRFVLFGDFNKDGLTDFYCPNSGDTTVGAINLGGGYQIDTLLVTSGGFFDNFEPKVVNGKMVFSSYENLSANDNVVFYLNEDDDYVVSRFVMGMPFIFEVFESSNSDLHGLVAYDFDNDGISEIIFSKTQNNQSSLNIVEFDILNPQAVDFNNASLISSISGDTYEVKEMELIDYNFDGFMDIIFTNNANNPEMYLVENTGGGNFLNPVLVDSRNNLQNLKIVDINNDFIADVLAFASDFRSITYYKNEGVNEELASGWIYHDINMNGVKDPGEDGLNTTGLQVNPSSIFSNHNADGSYQLIFNNTPQNYNLQFSNPLWQLTTPTSYSLNVNASYTTTNDLNFGVVPSSTLIDSVVFTSTSIGSVCDGIQSLNITASNKGNTKPSGVITVEVDDILTVNTVVPTPDSINGNNYYFSYANLDYCSNYHIAFSFNIPGFNSIGDTLENIVSSQFISSSGSSPIISDTLLDIITCPYDPNEKKALPLGFGPMNYISEEDTVIQYTINFQNTGTDTAVNVVLLDQLSPLFDFSTFELLTSKHPVNYTIAQSGLVSFNFDNIYLPDSNASYLNSQGFVTFTIELNDLAQAGSVIKNNAGIYFDSNPVVMTNTVERIIYNCSDASMNIVFDAYEDSLCGSFSGLLSLPNAQPAHGVFIGPGVTGNQYHYDSLQEGMNTFEYIVEGNLNCEYKKVFNIYNGSCLGLDDITDNVSWTVTPNPFVHATTIKLGEYGQTDYSIELYSLTGQFISGYNFNQQGEIKLERNNLESGMYIIKLLKKGTLVGSKKIVLNH